MIDPIDRLVLTEASFRADVISGLHREAQRLREHHTIVDRQNGARESLEQLVSVLESVADTLRAQDGHMARALGRWDGGREPRTQWRSGLAEELLDLKGGSTPGPGGCLPPTRSDRGAAPSVAEVRINVHGGRRGCGRGFERGGWGDDGPGQVLRR